MKEASSQSSRKQLKKVQFMLEGFIFIRIILISIIIFLVITNVVVHPSYIKGNSMYPTLKDGQIGVTSIIHRYIKKVSRFDIVVVNSQKENKKLAKRVIGLPNETIEYKDDKLYINGVIYEEVFLDVGYINDQTSGGQLLFTSDYGPITLKQDEYFLCGDNRRVSNDSRQLGPFKKSEIMSIGFFVLF